MTGPSTPTEPAGLHPEFSMRSLSALFDRSNWWQFAADVRSVCR